MQPNFLLQSEVPHMQDWLYGLIIVYWAHGINYEAYKAMLKYFFLKWTYSSTVGISSGRTTPDIAVFFSSQ